MWRVKALDAKDGLIPGSLIRNKLLTSRIDRQIKFFQDCHAEEDMLAKYHGCRRCASSEHFYDKDFSHIDFFYTTIGIFCLCPIETQKSKTICNCRWQDRAHSSCVNECFRLITMHLTGIALPEPSEHRFAIVGESDLHMDLPHGAPPVKSWTLPGERVAEGGEGHQRAPLHLMTVQGVCRRSLRSVHRDLL